MFNLGRMGGRAVGTGLVVAVVCAVPALAARPQFSTQGTYEGRTSQGQDITITAYPHSYVFRLDTKVTVHCPISDTYTTAPLELKMTLLPYRGGPNGYFRGHRVFGAVTTIAAGVLRAAGGPDVLGAVSVERHSQSTGSGLHRRLTGPCGSGKVTFQINHKSPGANVDNGTALNPATG